jgi:hypothetical protein
MLREEMKKLRTEKPNNTKKINHLKHLLRTETIQEVYRKLKHKTEPKQHNNIYLRVPTANNTHRTITNMDKIAQHIADFNMGHFTQAEHTPFSKFRYLPIHIDATSNVVSDESWSEQQYTQNVHLLVNVPEDNRIMAEKFLRNISTHPQETVKDIITLDDWTRKIKKWKEKTTTSPSGLHLGHYKVLLAPYTLSYDDNNEEKTELEHQQEAVFKAYMTILNISLQSAVSFKQWKNVHSICLFKDEDNRFVSQIQNMHIYKADYNLILKLKWEQAIALSENKNQLHSSQYGSRQQKRSIDPVLLEIILQEVSRFTRTPFLQINYNAQACYDRIIPDIAFALSRKHGVHHKIIQMVRETMKSSKYYIKLGSHVTPQSYYNKETTQLYGTDQGSGCSPHIWNNAIEQAISLIYGKFTWFRPDRPIRQSKHIIARNSIRQ